MRVLVITGDLAALGGIVGGTLNILPQAVGTVAAALGAVWYAVLLWDRLVNKKNPPPNA